MLMILFKDFSRLIMLQYTFTYVGSQNSVSLYDPLLFTV